MGRQVLSPLAIVLAAVSLFGCSTSAWTQHGANPGHTRANPTERTLTSANVESLQQAWSVPLLGSATEPLVRNGRAYIVSGDSGPPTEIEARSVRVDTGATEWDETLFTMDLWSEILLTGPTSFVGDEWWVGYFSANFSPGGGDVAWPRRLDPTDGSTLGQEDNGTLVGSDNVAAGDVVVQMRRPTSGAQRDLVVRDVTTLDTLWTAVLAEEGSGWFLDPSIDRAQIFVTNNGHQAGMLHAFPTAGCGSPTCEPTWSIRVPAWLGNPVAPRGGPYVYVARHLHAVGQGPAGVLAISPYTGDTMWEGQLPAGSGRIEQDMAFAGGYVFVAAGATLYAFRADGCGEAICAPAWAADLGANHTTAPTAAGDVVYVGTSGAVKAFDAGGCGAPPTCPAIATIATPGTPKHLIVAEGHLFAASDAALTAFAPSSG